MSSTIRVMTTPATVLRHGVELAVPRKGEDRWEMQARTLDELGYRVVDKDLIAVLPALAGALAEIAETVGLRRETEDPDLIVERVRALSAEVERLRADELDPQGGAR